MQVPPPGHGHGYGSPPYGGGYGGPPGPAYPGGYGGPPGPYGPGGGGPPPRSGSNAAVIALVVIVVLVVLGAGGCLVCGTLATVLGAHASDADAASPTGPTPTTAGESTIDRTPLAIQLEAALRNDGVPLDHVECPIQPPSTGSFACAVIPPNEGDPAEVTVTSGPSGMSYRLQEGFVILDGAKLASTFAGAMPAGSPPLNVPCFDGKILKHADTSFTCEVHGGGALVGYVTTHVIGRSGDVKMDFAPTARGGASPR